MDEKAPKMVVRTARKKLVAFILVGVLLLVLAPMVPSLVARFHLGSSRFGSRMEWRTFAVGFTLVAASAFVLIKFRQEKD